MSTQAIDTKPEAGLAKHEEPGKPSGLLPTDSPVIHEYDGILECDNKLPRWWLMTLYGAIVFAAGYWLYYQTYGVGQSPTAEYDAEQAVIRAAEAEKLKALGTVTPDMLVTLSKDDVTLKQGKEVFASTCASCHLATGAGQIGPNLTDAYWVHGGAPDAIYRTVRDGFLAKGMPAWGPSLGEERVRAVSAYLLTLKGTNVAGGKEPQGDKEP